MQPSSTFRIAVFPGDGIGSEVMPPCLALLDRASRAVGGFALHYDIAPAGAGCYRDTGEALPASSMALARKADAILLGAMGLPDVRQADGTEIAPQLDLRFELGLYAGVRPVLSIPGIAAVLGDPRAAQLDFVLVRESTEGLFASRGRGTVEGDREARDTMVITRAGTARVVDYALRLARRRRASGRPGRLACVDKANVFASLAFFRKVFDERARAFPDVAVEHLYVDATALRMVQRPWDLDVLVTENMFGDILSDLGAGLMGGLGFAPSADIGDEHAVFQPCHGTAPDIAGMGRANPTAMFLSAAMMLEWLDERHGHAPCGRAAGLIRAAIGRAFRRGALVPCERGGTAGTGPIAAAVVAEIESEASGAA
ncbi:MAG: isocitrate/isopropylmalate dehydrogenase family protein [Candidatus Odyssella sp.]|nr:isocitrate/isopropylmalate dehydrogenase family protein [Candidatus Odyssella sp.]